MSFSDIRALKKEESTELTPKFIRHLVVGEDVHSIALYKTLIEKYGESEVQLLCQKELTPLEVLPKGPSSLRGEANIEAFKKLYPEVEITLVEKEAEYFKEQEFRKFSGRGKSEPLLWGEEFYKGQRAELNLAQVYPFLKDEEFFTKLNERKWDNTLLNINQVEPTELIENTNWTISTTIGEMLQSEHLYWGLGPEAFLQSYENKNQLSDEFIQFCESTHAPASLYIKYVFDEPITDKEETLFVPLSYTHEWGHFIGEFGTENGKQFIEFILYVDINQQNEEDISRKIRLLKRHIEKIFKKAKKISCTEFITLEKHTSCPEIDDALYQKGLIGVKNLEMISVNGPFGDSAPTETIFEDSKKAPSHLMRALARQKIVEDSLQ